MSHVYYNSSVLTRKEEELLGEMVSLSNSFPDTTQLVYCSSFSIFFSFLLALMISNFYTWKI